MNERNHGGASTATVIPARSQYATNTRDKALIEFTNWCDDCGVVSPALKPFAWVRMNAPGKSYSNKALAAMDKGDCIIVHNFITDETHTFGGCSSRSLTLDERAALDIERQRKNDERKQENITSISAAQRFWEASESCSSTAYTDARGVGTHGCPWHRGERCLVVPLRNIDGKLQSVQRIYDDKAKGKRYFKGAPTRGAFFAIGRIVDCVLICEGFATGATLYEKTCKPVVCAMDAGNLLTVANAIRIRHPRIAITICGDDDRRTTGNPGRTKAVAAADAVHGKLAMPELCSGCDCSDFNDQARCTARGAGAV